MGRQSKFTREEKNAAVKMVTEGGRTTLSVANEYGIHENTVFKWRQQYEINPSEAFNKAPQSVEDGDADTERLKRRVKELENEVEFLKKYPRILQRTRSEVRAGPEARGEDEYSQGMQVAWCAAAGVLRVV